MARKISKLTRLDNGPHDFMKIITHLAINIFALLTVAYILPGFTLIDLRAAIFAAIIIGIINTYLRPILQLIALPITIITFGIGAFVVNVFLLLFASFIVPGFQIDGFVTAAIASILLTLISWFLHNLSK